MTNTEGKTLITRNQSAEVAGVSSRTISRWAKAGLITTYKTGNGHVRHDRAEVERMGQPVAVAGPGAESEPTAEDLSPEPEAVPVQRPTLRERMEAANKAAKPIVPQPRRF